MKTITVNTHKSYDIIIERGSLNKIGAYAKDLKKSDKVMVVTDDNVAPFYLEAVKKSLKENGFRAYECIITAGERNKSPQTYLSIINALAKNNFVRDDLVVALGGGVVGDIAGFAAATYMRGISIIQVPTTLLAAIDSSIGGKTGVDLEEGKNLLGAFWQPLAVITDIDVLNTLPAEEISNGLGEGVKYAVLAGGKIAEILENGLNDVNIEDFISISAKIKADIVAADEREGDQRKLLNLGHTIGHALEKLSNYEIAHGIAVAVGIKYMTKAALKAGEIKKAEADIIFALINKCCTDTVADYTAEDIMRCISMDKKRHGEDKIDFVKIRSVGKCEICSASQSGFAEYVFGGVDK